MTTPLPPSPTPLVLARLSRNEAQARNLVAQHAQGISVALGDTSWLLDLQPWTQDSGEPEGSNDNWLIQGRWGGAPFDLLLPAGSAQTWLSARFPSLELPNLSAAFATAALETAMENVATALLALQRGPAAIEHLDQAPTQGRRLAHRFDLTLRSDAQILLGVLATDTLGLMLMAGMVVSHPAKTNGLRAEDTPVVLQATIGTTQLPGKALEGLVVGDTVLIDQPWITADHSLWLTCGEGGLRVQWNDNQLTVTQALTPSGPAMTTPDQDESTDAAQASDTPMPIDAVPVRLTFDLGQRQIRWDELKALQVGQSLDLARPLSQAVNIRANGALIGTGELVEIDGRLGVTIAQLASPRN
jgi:type III secretion protein Q